jgi:cytochrome c-type biogenesis protein CcmH/NrfG
MSKQKRPVKKVMRRSLETRQKSSPRDRKKLFQRIVFGILAAVLGLGLIISSIVWIPGFEGGRDKAPGQVQPPPPAAELEEKARANPNDTGVLVQLAQAYQRENNVPKAVETYEKAVALDPGKDDLKNRLAGSYISAGRYDQAIKILEEVISRNPDNKEAHYYYGHALAAKKEYGKAVEEFERYVKLAGEDDPEAGSVKRLIETLKPLVK